MSDVTQVLQAIRRGDGRASEELLPLVYNEMRQLRRRGWRRRLPARRCSPPPWCMKPGCGWSAAGDRTWQNRAHFFGAAAEAMRRILIENARRKSRLKRGGGQLRLDIEELELAAARPTTRFC